MEEARAETSRRRPRASEFALTRLCVHPPKVKELTDASGMVVRWEHNVRRLQMDCNEGACRTD